MKHLAGLAQVLGLIVVAAVLAELPPIKSAVQAVDRLRDPLLGAAIAVTALGFTLMMGGILSGLMTSGEPMTHEEIEAAISQRRGAGEPAVWRASAHRVFGTAAGAQASYHGSFSGMKDAWRTGEWRRDSHWRRLFIAGCGAALLSYGLFGLFVVIGPPPIKLLMAGAIAYGTVMTIRGFARA